MRWLLRIALLLLTLIIVAVAALFLVPSDSIARLAEKKFEENTGRKLTLSGEVRPMLYPRLGVVLNGVEIENADWTDQSPMLEADRLELGVGLSAILGGDLVVEAFSVDAPVIRLERDSEGRANWDFVAQMGGEDTADSATPSVSVPLAQVTNGRLIYRDPGQSHELTNLDVEFRAADLSSSATLDLNAQIKGQPLAVTGSFDGLQQLLDGDVRGVEMSVAVGPNTANFQGKAGLDPVQAEGRAVVAITDQNPLFALLDQTPPVIPVGLGQQVNVTADATYTADNKVFLRGAVIDLDQNRLSGDIDVNLAETPEITARLTGDVLDFSAMSTDSSEGDGAANAGAGGWSDARLDVSGLSAVNGTILFTANAVDLGSIRLGKTDLKAAIDNSRMVVDFTEIGIFGGGVGGQFVVNGRNGLSVRADLKAREIEMQNVLDDFAGYDRLSGRADMDLNFLGVGESMNEIMNGLEGSGALNVGAGAIEGLDIAGMIKNLDSSYRGEGSKTVFDAISATFAINGGVLRNDDLNFAAPLLSATGAGDVDLGGQTVEYRIDPLALSEQISGGIRVPILISGPWSALKFRPDLKALIDTELEAKKEELKAAAKAKEAELKAAAAAKEAELKAKAEAKLEEELGVTAEEGKSIEDSLKESLEDKAKSGLRKLFGD